MGVFANVPQDKYDSLSAEDKKAVDEWRNQEADATVQANQAGSYNDVVGQDTKTTTTKKSAK